MRVLVFGDSITQGFYGSEGGWVELLNNHYRAKALKDLRNNHQPEIFNLGISADNSADVLKRVKAEVQARVKPRHKGLIIVQIGVNDSSLSRDVLNVGIESEVYADNLRQIVDQIQSLNISVVFVGLSACDESFTTPVFWNDIDYTNESLKSYETIMQQVAQEKNINFIAVFDKFKAALDSGQDLLADGLHPNSAGHQLIFEIVHPELQKSLQ